MDVKRNIRSNNFESVYINNFEIVYINNFESVCASNLVSVYTHVLSLQMIGITDFYGEILVGRKE